MTNARPSFEKGAHVHIHKHLHDIESDKDPRLEADYFEYIEPEHSGIESTRSIGILSAALNDADNSKPPASLQIKFHAFEREWEIQGNRTSGLFADDYKEIRDEGDDRFAVRNATSLHCLYHGTVHGKGETLGFASFSTCQGGINGAVWHMGKLYEITFIQHEGAHVIVDTEQHTFSREYTCGVGHEKDPHHVNALAVDDETESNSSESPTSNPSSLSIPTFGPSWHPTANVSTSSPTSKAPSVSPATGSPSATPLTSKPVTEAPSNAPTSLAPTLPGDDLCANGPTKVVDILLINDKRRIALRGLDTAAHSALIFQYMDFLFRGGDYGGYTFEGITDGVHFNCHIRLRLVGQLFWESANPTTMKYTSTNCEGECGLGYACSKGEVSDLCLRQSLALYVANNKNALAQIFGVVGIDAVMLFTGESLAGGVVGTAYPREMCSSFSQSIAQAGSSSAIFTAKVAAHELGHSLGMQHDSSESSDSDTIMSSQLSRAFTTSWSNKSRSDINTFMTQGSGLDGCYATYSNSESLYGTYKCAERQMCLEDSGPASSWKSSTCGNGIIDEGEQCDPGVDFFASDTCCDSTCKLTNGCVCANQDECCANGQILSAGHICRPANNEACDMQETCTGMSSRCPADQFKKAGTACEATTQYGVTDIQGKCFKGRCISVSDNCQAANPVAYLASGVPDESVCTDVQCIQCPTDCLPVSMGPGASGTPCGSDKQCVASRDGSGSGNLCVSSSELVYYHWALSCPEGLFCYDEEGTKVADIFCVSLAKPSFSCASPTPYPSSCPTITPTNAPSASPSLRPSRSPTTTPTLNPTGTGYTGMPSTSPSTSGPSASPTTLTPTHSPTTRTPSTNSPSVSPTSGPTLGPTTVSPTSPPVPTRLPTQEPTRYPTKYPSSSPTPRPSTCSPSTRRPTSSTPSSSPTTAQPLSAFDSASPTYILTQGPSPSPSLSPSSSGLDPFSSSPSLSPISVSPTTIAPTIQRFACTITFQGLISDVDPEFEDQMRGDLSSLLGIADDAFRISFVSGSIKMTVIFFDVSNGKTPLEAARTLVSFQLSTLATTLRREVISVSAVVRAENVEGGNPVINPGVANESSASRGSDMESLALGVVIGISFSIFVGLGVWSLNWFLKRRDREEAEANDRDGRVSLRSPGVRSPSRNHRSPSHNFRKAVGNLSYKPDLDKAFRGSPSQDNRSNIPNTMDPVQGDYLLPPDWRQELTVDGTPYYLNVKTQVSQWDRPQYSQPEMPPVPQPYVSPAQEQKKSRPPLAPSDSRRAGQRRSTLKFSNKMKSMKVQFHKSRQSLAERSAGTIEFSAYTQPDSQETLIPNANSNVTNVSRGSEIAISGVVLETDSTSSDSHNKFESQGRGARWSGSSKAYSVSDQSKRSSVTTDGRPSLGDCGRINEEEGEGDFKKANLAERKGKLDSPIITATTPLQLSNQSPLVLSPELPRTRNLTKKDQHRVLPTLDSGAFEEL
eukprot:CAMPEP_0184482780 /NCGR_PEP_ID=MMETSP0113_2-20130426/4363_1 /TAXON_ID=91329 /ORGANISM="Norrisiella sphaerica, Strain BC52" /LENGTH=1475 /DNA_ID=CAMNT_0026862741 /DNA_START=410 /DNA_END=4837 /DNA_ORIENTATION=+